MTAEELKAAMAEYQAEYENIGVTVYALLENVETSRPFKLDIEHKALEGIQMSTIIPFNFESHNIRAIKDNNGEPWFNAKDICEVLEYANPHDAIANHIHEDDLAKIEVIDSLGRPQKTNHINESGVYALIFGSKKESAKRFKRWVTSEVLPSIRKTGSYTAPKPKAQRAKLPDEVKALLMIGKAVAQVPGVNPNLAFNNRIK